jgi:two-component system chemotaxis response regulator CheB
MMARPEHGAPSPQRPAAVVIGGSAGSLDVLRGIIRVLPAQLACPVVVVLHMGQRAPERLSELLARECALPVRQVEDKEPAEGGVVYLAPPGYHLLIESHRAFALSVDEPVYFSRPSIDVLFESACDAYDRHLLAMLLSGASADGAAGMLEAHRRGATTIVQTPDSAESPAMPLAALALFNPTCVWTPAEMARELPALLADIRTSATGSPA